MSIGIWQIVLILVVVLIVFGAGRLPSVMGDVAKGIKNFKENMNDEPETVNVKASPAKKAPTKKIAKTSTAKKKATTKKAAAKKKTTKKKTSKA